MINNNSVTLGSVDKLLRGYSVAECGREERGRRKSNRFCDGV